ncbi:iron chelate uptake ABC transporter family permease subunit [Halocella sp. SP3-1]|uniref:metal ABC transporter permease n=1 Tax=Halocella sp. SP3-1 TaxID=2382161 RepID=UPI000F76382F|nr:iron chelate uptake ABC transporter family permease subunit [Halocella sp. SP3-1]AZO95940.1 metal ABC transporter permease [Halocella sp. SP3-1]
METFRLFLTDYTLQIVSLGSALLGIVSAVIGSFAVLRQQSLLGDAVSHAALPGIALAFMFTQRKETAVLLLGALITGLLAALLVIIIDRYSRIKFDSALALVLSVFFGGGLVLLTYLQKIPNANQAGLDKFIFGQASTLLKSDINTILVVGLIIILTVIFFWKEFKIISFDPEFAESMGFSRRKLTLLLSGLLVAAIIIGLQTVGVILMSSMLIAPGVAARQWTNKLSMMLILAAFFGGVSGLIGTVLSSSITHMPTGPTIIIVISIFVLLSLIFAKNRGILWKLINQKKMKKDKNSISKGD